MFYFARQLTNRANTRRMPVVFVPGVMGSRLAIVQDGRTFRWDPDDSAIMLSTWIDSDSATMRDRLSHHNDASILEDDAPTNAREQRRGWAGIVWDAYGGFLRALQRGVSRGRSLECPVWAFPYDWRHSNDRSAKRLQAAVENILEVEKSEQAIFVTHSMGGIVVRQALREKGAFKKRVAGVVHIAQPVLGAPVAYRRFLFGLSRRIDGWTMRYLMGRTPEDTANLFSVLPGAMELLPHDGRTSAENRAHEKWLKTRSVGQDVASGTFPGKWTLDLYTWASHPPSLTAEDSPVRAAVTSLARAASAFHRALKVEYHKPTRSIVGTSVETDSSVVLQLSEDGLEGCAIDVAAGRDDKGDGTVPKWSAEALFPGEEHPIDRVIEVELQRQWIVEEEEHDQICKSSRVQEVVIATIHAMMNPPTMAAGSVKSEGVAAFLRLVEALAGDRSAEIELRVAKLLAQEGQEVVVLGNPDSTKTPDLSADGGWVEVKLAEGDRASIEGRVRHALDQIGLTGTVVLVRGVQAREPLAAYEEAGAAALIARFGADPFTARVRVIEESVLPPLRILDSQP